jgi:toxin YoeB
MAYLVIIEDEAKEDIVYLKRTKGKATVNKIERLLCDLQENPRKGTGKPEPLKENLAGLWSRRIDKKNRLIYRINDSIVTVLVISARGHYDDK